MATKPSKKISWTSGNATPSAVRTEPSAGKKTEGWGLNERPAFQFMNWLFWNIYEWLEYFEDVTDDFVQGSIVVVNANNTLGDFTTLQAAIDDINTVAGTQILVTSDLEISSAIQVSKQDIEIEFRPGCEITKAVGAPNMNAMEVTSTGDRVRLKHPRFTGFTGGSDVCLDIEASVQSVFVFNPIFASGQTQNVNDNGNSTYVLIGEQVL